MGRGVAGWRVRRPDAHRKFVGPHRQPSAGLSASQLRRTTAHRGRPGKWNRSSERRDERECPMKTTIIIYAVVTFAAAGTVYAGDDANLSAARQLYGAANYPAALTILSGLDTQGK